MGPRSLGRSLGIWMTLGAWAALAMACSSNRPLRGPAAGAAGGSVPLTRCERPGDRCCAGAACSDGLICDDASDTCVACGNDGQLCCTRGCNLGLACDHALRAPLGVCTAACGLTDHTCCSQGECEEGSTCSVDDGPGGTCKGCGIPGLKCCRGDCWIGVCKINPDKSRVCVPCGEKTEPCCDGIGTEPEGCSDGSSCLKAPGDLRGVCTAP